MYGVTQEGVTQEGVTQEGVTQEGVTQEGVTTCTCMYQRMPAHQTPRCEPSGVHVGHPGVHVGHPGVHIGHPGVHVGRQSFRCALWTPGCALWTPGCALWTPGCARWTPGCHLCACTCLIPKFVIPYMVLAALSFIDLASSLPSLSVLASRNGDPVPTWRRIPHHIGIAYEELSPLHCFTFIFPSHCTLVHTG